MPTCEPKLSELNDSNPAEKLICEGVAPCVPVDICNRAEEHRHDMEPTAPVRARARTNLACEWLQRRATLATELHVLLGLRRM